MNFISRVSLGFLLALLVQVDAATNVLAQDRPIDILPDELKAGVNEALSSALDALHIYSSADTVSSGYYVFDEDAEPDTKLDVLKVLGEYTFSDGPDDTFVPLISGLIGNVRLRGDIPPLEESPGPNDFLTLSTTSIGLGGGFDWTVFGGLHIVPKMTFVYSHSENTYDYNNEGSQLFLQPFDGDLFNWDVDTISYLPSLKAYYRWMLGKVRITPSAQYSHLHVDSFWTNSALLDVKTNTDILKTRVGVAAPLGAEISGMPLENELFGALNFIYGDAEEALGFPRYNEVGTLISALSSGQLPWFSKLGVGATYVWNSNFDGWRVGLEGEF
ncbi:MAG: hypothetical protein K1X83_14475 [Oligoflexia bacterium]|nr:hypothetical protein [Oligoflexia bacterium]